MFISQSKVRIVIVALLLTMFGWLLTGDFVVEKADAATLNAPRIVEDSSMNSGQKVIWDCIYFGSYPQREVIADEVSYDATPLFSDEDVVIEDAALFSALENATGWNRNGNIIISGNKYHRMKKNDATYSVLRGNNFYKRENSSSYHYFKYEPIKWRVLDVSGSDAFLLADKALDTQRYNRSYDLITWEKSTIRSWLNGYGSSKNESDVDYTDSNFIDSAFASSQENAVKTTLVVNKKSINYGTDGGNGTHDKIFFLSESEVYDTANAESYGFIKASNILDEGRWSKSSTYAKAMGAYSDGKFCNWWLRSPGEYFTYAAYVSNDHDGYVAYGGVDVNTSNNAVRPALHLDISSSELWSYAGTVSSKPATSIGDCEALLSGTKYTYDGKIKTPKVTLYYENKKLEETIDYTVSYAENRKDVGKYKVVIKGVGDFYDTSTLYFTINPKSTSLSKLTATKKGFTAKWKKQSTQTSGYQIMYAKNSSFTSGKKTVTVSSNKTISKKITKLKAKKKYYVKVRTYKKVGSKTYYSSWSKYKTVKTK